MGKEALLAGCRCLISNKAGSCCLIEDGVNGYVFDPYHIDELTSYMLKIKQIRMSKKISNGLRPSLMAIHYNDYMEQLIDNIAK